MSSAQSTLSVFQRIRNIVCEQLHVSKEKVTRDAEFSELGADSLDTVELVMAIEEEFSIEIPDKDAESMRTLSQAIEFIEKAMKDSKS
uniref:Acyl carrier protein n=1 Tax=Gracilariopsis longissima TaxID=172976 RepID=A0A345U9M3_9FLOR|nr:acyl carrier protein [Gracilariopsis longissima]AXI97159.1 acyl carrier protein [Gracilariopsis longissima]UAD89075.1 acyl carrier protein [Gracilariopsis longissima]